MANIEDLTEETDEKEIFTTQRRIFGDDPKLSPEELDEISKHETFTFRYAVALNPSTSIETRIRLANDEDEDVANSAKAWIISNSILSEKELEKLSCHQSPAIRQAVAINRNTSTETVMKLTLDEDEQVANNAKKVIQSQEDKN